jgi:hypothetical protein
VLRDRPKKPSCRPKRREANVLDPAGLFAVLGGLAPGQRGATGETAETAEQFGATREALAFVASRRLRHARVIRASDEAHA